MIPLTPKFGSPTSPLWWISGLNGVALANRSGPLLRSCRQKWMARLKSSKSTSTKTQIHPHKWACVVFLRCSSSRAAKWCQIRLVRHRKPLFKVGSKKASKLDLLEKGRPDWGALFC
ncbi:UNVERIFIED_CONTAM: hypothetical protein GTU68_025714 [Idotea baltica]|nr:hypothetical protein [Idotea baltica]